MSSNPEFSLVCGGEGGDLAVITSEQREILGLSTEWPRAVWQPCVPAIQIEVRRIYIIIINLDFFSIKH